MAATFEKENANTLKVTRTIPEAKSYDFSFLKSQRAQILKDLAEVDALIAQATTLGIVEKAVAAPTGAPK